MAGENLEVLIDTCINGEANLPIPIEEEFIVLVKDALGYMLDWPRHLVLRCSDLEKVTAKPGRKRVIDEVKNKGQGPQEKNKTCGEKKKQVKTEKKEKKVMPRKRTRGQKSQRIIVETNQILKLTSRIIDQNLSKDKRSTKIQCEDGLFAVSECYTYVFVEDFEVVLTMDKLTGAVITGYMMYLYEQIKHAGKTDHGICFLSPSAISKDGRMDTFMKGDEASGAIACRLSTRKDNHIILMPYNPGDHWVLAVLDMQIGSCYYLDSAGHGNVDRDLKRIIEVAWSIYARKSGSNQTSLKWINVECPIQPGITECGYYVLKFMKAIVDEGLEVLTNNFWGKVTYTDAELDMVREEWCSYVTNFVY